VLEMVEKLRSGGNGDQGDKAAPGKKDAPGGGQAGAGSVKPYVNDRGEVCFGNECFSLAVDADRGEVRVTINRDECGVELQETLDQLHQVLGRGARTVYETKSTPT